MTSTDAAILELTERVAAVEKSASHAATTTAVREEQARMLIRLRGIREAMLTSAADGSGVTGGKDVRKLREENDDLKKKCQKYEYRIMHLVRNLEAAMEKIGSN
mmetsp:Transcript_50718/g.99144  ORF Transcript_50718/g.99144 Transcript_50718/m.99144 type:complete len:104 (+) Transcript_50718:52-363(+)